MAEPNTPAVKAARAARDRQRDEVRAALAALKKIRAGFPGYSEAARRYQKAVADEKPLAQAYRDAVKKAVADMEAEAERKRQEKRRRT